MKKLIQFKLKILAKLVLKKYKPEVVGITGSIGKTSAKEAIFAVLSKKFNVRRNIKNYNNEIGVPLTILGIDSPGKFIFGWLVLFIRTLKLLIFQDDNYPGILILEMGVDKPDDMAYLISITRCNIGVITMIAPVHLENFGSMAKLENEKGLLAKSLKENGWAVLNYDNDRTRQIAKTSQAKVITYGFESGADLRAQEIVFSGLEHGYEKDAADFNKLAGISFKLSYSGSFVPVLLPNVIGKAAVYSALAGASVGIVYGMNLVEISESLKSFKSPPGRMNLIPGLNNTLIVDDTYNSSPPAALAGLDVIKEIPISPVAKRIAVLGDMLELGSYSAEGHREVGRHLVACGIAKLVFVGVRAFDIARAAEEAGLQPEFIFHFDDSETAGKFLRSLITEGDLIFVKGSQGMRMEKAVKEIMLEPEKAKDLLVRQDEEWLRK